MGMSTSGHRPIWSEAKPLRHASSRYRYRTLHYTRPGMTIESLQDPPPMSRCWPNLHGVLLLLLLLPQVLHQGFVRCGRAHATPPSICTFLRPSTVLTMPACLRLLFGCRIH
ncbi:hypothetical protein B0T13DRAFT_52984 [Neurospora crassa]|nr:hypothetical protein B0T13DRAFT_52984 [Neurospora crassa]